MRAMVLLPAVCLLLTTALQTFASDAVPAGRPQSGLPWEDSDLWTWTIRGDRPRIWLDESRLIWLRRKVEGKSLDEIKALAGTSSEGLALVYAITGDEASGRAAIDRVIGTSDKGRYSQAPALAIVYDWCRPLFTGDEAARVRKWMSATLKSEMASGRTWRSFHNACYSHAYAAGFSAIALAHEDPVADEALRFLSAEMRDAMKVFDILFPDGEWAEGHDYNRVSTYPAFRLFWALKTATGIDLMADSPHMRNTALFMLYSARPDGLVYCGDDNDHPCITDLDREMALMVAAEWRDPYAQSFLNNCGVEMFVPVARNRWRDLLWYDETIAERPLETLPPSRVFRGKGLVMTRSGWGWNENKPALPVAWITFKCSPYYGDHTHFDNAHFDIYYKGGLAIDSGRYDDDWGMERDPEEVRKSQFFNYYQRTIAHNTVLVYDPEERWETNVVNDGGQKALLIAGGLRNSPEDYDQGTFPSDGGKRGSCDWATNPGRWDTGSLLAYSGNKLFTYACGDAAKSYSDTKLKSFVRQFLFIQPDVVVVFDRVVAAKPEFKKTWLLHTIEEPRLLESPAFEAVSRAGRLACVPVLPEKPSIARIGGPGNEFLVGSIQYACGPNASSGRTAELFHGETPGAWRIELCPSQASAEDYFLNVILLTDRASSALPEVKVLSNDASAVAVSIAGGSGGVAQLTFAKGDRPSALLKLTRDDKVLFEGQLPDKVTVEEGRPW